MAKNVNSIERRRMAKIVDLPLETMKFGRNQVVPTFENSSIYRKLKLLTFFKDLSKLELPTSAAAALSGRRK